MMFVNTHNKYTPQSLDEFVFSNEEVKELATAYASGHLERPLILHGVSGGGKSLLQKLIPNAIEGREASVRKVKCAALKTADDIHDLYGRNKRFNRLYRDEGQKFNYIIIEEFSLTNKRLIDAMKIELDETLGTDLTIISTNRFDEIDDALVSRSEVLEVHPCDPHVFFPHAKKMFEAENVQIDDAHLMKCLEVTHSLKADNRKYYSAIDAMFRKM
jgi:chromosomal replication initiation ATPase DnaA